MRSGLSANAVAARKVAKIDPLIRNLRITSSLSLASILADGDLYPNRRYLPWISCYSLLAVHCSAQMQANLSGRAPKATRLLNNRRAFDWDDLKPFLAVARAGSTLRAARLLGVSLPTVQRRITALEKSLGCQLVERHPNGYRLPALGAELVREAAAHFGPRICDP